VFGSLFDGRPRVGVVDAGASRVAEMLRASEAVDARDVASAEELERMLRAFDLDAGLVLEPGFDAALAAGERPLLPLYLAGDSLASDRVLVSLTAIDLVRAAEGRSDTLHVSVVRSGDAPAQDLFERLLPLVVLLALIIASVFVPSFSLVEERERGTLNAILATPATLVDVLVAKGVLGFVLGVSMAVVTLALNGLLASVSAALLASLVVGSVMAVLIGLLFGTLAKDAATLFTLIKSLSILLLAPALFYLFPDWPQWIARLFPTYWFIDPIVAATSRGAGLGDVAFELVVAVAWCAVLAVVVALAARRLQGPGAATH
jgi:ABC-2 type transport system permease protein